MSGSVSDRLRANLPVLVAVVIALVLVWARFVSEGIREAGDGVQHHMIARYSWVHPRLFLDQWGKPMFTLLASPFAQFGYKAMAVFNACCAVATTWMALRFLLRAGSWTAALFPVVLMLAPQYAHLVIDGMTEILFGTMALFAVLLLHERRARAAAIVASLTPLCRPEYVVFLPVVVGWLSWRREFKAIPWCALGIGLYTVVGILYTGDPLCWWHGDPYGSGKSIYGSGDPWRFIQDAPKALGWTLTVLFLAAVLLWPAILRKDKEERTTHRLLFFTAAGPAALIVAVHAYLWWSGTHGSAGFTRVLVTAAPLAAVFALFTVGRGVLLLARPERSGPALLLAGASAAVLDLHGHGSLVQDPNDDQVIIHQACDRILQERRPGDRLFTTHPYVPFRVGLDGFDENESRMLWGFNGMSDNVPSRPRDIVFWESAFGPNECGVELSRLLDDTAFTVRGLYVPKHGHTVLGGRPYEVWVFQRVPSKRYIVRDTLGVVSGDLDSVSLQVDTVRCADGPGWCPAKEFPWTWAHVPAPGGATLFDEWVVEADIHYFTEAGEDAMMVFKRERGGELVRYDDRPLREGVNRISFRVPRDTVEADQGMYIYSPAKRRFRCSSLRVVRERVLQERPAAALNP